MMQNLVDAQQSHLSAPPSSLYNRLPEKDRGTKVLEVGARAVFCKCSGGCERVEEG